MATEETNLMIQCMIALSKVGCRIFRNNVAMAWVGNGKTERGVGMPMYVGPHDVVIRDARPLHAGLHKGSGDLIGWMPVVVTPDMVGSTVAVFVSPEIKTQTGRASADQKTWINAVNRDGGRAGIARSAAEAVEIACTP